MKSWFAIFSIIIWPLLLWACNTEAPSVTYLVVDFPHGELRLVIQREGDAWLSYGALPTYHVIPNRTFNIDDVYQQLLPRLHEVVPAEARPLGQPYGMATIELSDGSEQNYLIYDATFMAGLFKTACANLVENEDSGGEVITTACANLEGQTP